MCVHVCVCCFFSTLFVAFSSTIATYSNQLCPQFTTWSHALAKATSIQLPPAGTPLGNRHAARVSDIAAFTANICYSQPPLIMVPVSLPFMANTEEPFFLPLHAVLPWFATIAQCIAVHHSTSTPHSGECDSTGPLLG